MTLTFWNIFRINIYLKTFSKMMIPIWFSTNKIKVYLKIQSFKFRKIFAIIISKTVKIIKIKILKKIILKTIMMQLSNKKKTLSKFRKPKEKWFRVNKWAAKPRKEKEIQRWTFRKLLMQHQFLQGKKVYQRRIILEWISYT